MHEEEGVSYSAYMRRLRHLVTEATRDTKDQVPENIWWCKKYFVTPCVCQVRVVGVEMPLWGDSGQEAGGQGVVVTRSRGQLRVSYQGVTACVGDQ